ncbi:MAG: CopG family transcriptional regulator [Alicyclobacillus sp.]|nr:CopG family transcriptional regulator [Alicyclobacillus sp.]
MADLEKVTVNLGVVDLGQIDLLIEQGFYSNRTDFIKTAVRNQLVVHGDQVRETITKRQFSMGITHYGRRELERALSDGKRLNLKVIGMLVLGDDISPDLADQAIDTVEIYGVVIASRAIKRILSTKSTGRK